MSLIATDQASWELKSEPGKIFNTAELKARAPLRREALHEMEVRLVGTEWWHRLTDIEALTPRRLGTKRRCLQLIMRAVMWLSASVGGLFWSLLAFGFLITFFEAYLNLAEGEGPIDFSTIPGEVWKALATIGGIVFILGLVAGVLSRRLTHPWIPVRRALWVELRSFVAAYAFGVSMVFFLIALSIVIKWAELLSESQLGGDGMWLDCMIAAVGGLIFLSFTRTALFSPVEETRLPYWLEEIGASIRMAFGRSRYISRMLLSILPIFGFFMLPAILQIAKILGFEHNTYYLGIWVVGLMLLGILIWIQFKGLAFRLSGPSPFRILRSDPRPPVLFLRNFRNDAGFMGKTGEISDEQDWSEAFDSMVGPPVAIGRPGEWLSSLGAPRIYIKNDEENSWQKVVEALIKESALVIFPADLDPNLKNPPEGLKWELDQALKSDYRKVVFLVGRNRFPEGYHHFRKSMQETLLGTGSIKAGLPESADPGSIIAIQNGIPTVLRGKFGWGTLFLASLGSWQRSAILAEQTLSIPGITGFSSLSKKQIHDYSSVKMVFPVVFAFLFVMLVHLSGGGFSGVWIIACSIVIFLISRLKRSVDRFGIPMKIMMLALQKPDRPAPAAWNRREFLSIAPIWIAVAGVIIAGLAHGACKLIEIYISSH